MSPRTLRFLVVAALTAAVGLVDSASAAVRVIEVGQPRIVLEHKDDRGQDAYDYAPTTMYENGGYTTWWCGTGDDGRHDRIYRARSARLGSGWGDRREVFQGQGDRAFDGNHTCDPDVIKDEHGYTMYYGGLGDTRGGAGTQDDFTEIGVATSPDGIHWTRENAGRPLIGPMAEHRGVAYGAGQPSVVRANGWYTMIYTTVAPKYAGGPVEGGEYAVRSRDHLFRTALQERRRSGWVTLPDRAHGASLAVNREHRLFGGDHCQNLTYLNEDGRFATIGSAGLLRFLDENLNVVAPVRRIGSPMFREQRTFVRSGWGKVFRSQSGLYNLSLMAAIKGRNRRSADDPFSWDLGVQPLVVAWR